MQKSLKRALLENLIPLGIALVIPFVLSAIGFPFGITISIFIMLSIIIASGMDILFGYSGQMSMGHAGFYAIGAYGSALISIHLGIPVLLSILIAPVLAAAVGALLAYPASKLRFHFLALATIAFGQIIFQLALQSPGGITGDAVGLRVPRLDIFGIRLGFMGDPIATFLFLLFIVVLMLIAKTNIVNSRVGRALVAIRENPHAADGMGVNVRKYKIIAFAVSAFFVALAGSLFAHIAGWVSPDGFNDTQSVLFVTMLLLGGTASKWGPVIGACVVIILQEQLRPLANISVLIYGAILLFVIWLMPGGIVGTVKDFIAWTHRLNKSHVVDKKGGK